MDVLPDDVIFAILRVLAAAAASPSDLAAVRITCKRLNKLGLNPSVLQMVSVESLRIRADKWSQATHQFLNRCVDAGNLEACYIMGMIQFYCLGDRQNGALLMRRAANGKNAAALFSLAVILFNGSGGSEADRNIQLGSRLCILAAYRGHVDALFEMEYFTNCILGPECTYFGAIRTIMPCLRDHHPEPSTRAPYIFPTLGWSTMSKQHPVNRFLVEWFHARGGVVPEGEQLRLCSNNTCGRPETRRNEFKVCNGFCDACYCSRACRYRDVNRRLSSRVLLPNWK